MGEQDKARQEYDIAIVGADSEGDRLEYAMQSAATYVREHRYVEADQAFRSVANEADKEGFARIEAAAWRSMAMYQPQFAAALGDAEQAEQALRDAHSISKS